ncbi:MAG: NAD(P)(+) transhydrogenase (Re/Si-specific) subunit beta [Candidatus Anammoximicrobium sp.]|nr:NAD(P)(+) transhydrogenase (Re/Si-specific) subunit beta [Candidatus Anammoximicrobium sp.]
MNVLVQLCYVLAAVLFIFGLKMMSHPRTAVRGNLCGSLGMLIAIVATLWLHEVVTYEYILVGVLIGSIAGAWLALKVPMTAMPQMVGLLNGFGGGASVLVAGAELLRGGVGEINPYVAMVATAVSGIIGAVTFWGSLVAFGKLQELKMFKKPVSLPGQQAINVVLLILAVLLAGWMVAGEPAHAAWTYLAIVVIASVLGVFLVNPIGGADMPVVIALLNSYSGLAACATGFVINNSVLIIAGSLVGASGIILSNIMCKAMNRSLTNVLFGVMEAGSLAGSADEFYATVRSTTADDIAMLLDGVQRVVFVPGYGMAVAQAQHAVRDLGKIIEERGGTVEYAIHPVAGRMPGHMNVLLAEADVDYEQLKEMDQINPTMETVDVAIVIGANDVVNPLAKTDPNSPIAGMPIIDVDKARTVVVIKRSLSPGFAGIPNPLFGAPNTLMFFADGQKAVLDIVRAVKEL